MSNLVIVAIPKEDDYVWKISSEPKPHMTLLFLGEAQTNPNLMKIVEFVEHAVKIWEQGSFMLDVDHRGTLGPDEADVVFFRKDWGIRRISEFRDQLLQFTPVKTAYDSVEQYPEWSPHLTLGYPPTPAKKDTRDYPGIRWVEFDRIAVWYGDSEGSEFQLEYNYDLMEVAMSDTAELGVEFLEHFGVKGMKWGVRKVDKAYGRAERLAGDIKFESRKNKTDTIVSLVSEARTKMAKEDLPAINAKHKASAKTGGKYQNLKILSRVPAQKAYKADVQAAYLKRLNEAAESRTNASGTKQYTIKSKSATRWKVKSRDIKHADDEVEVELVLDKDGFIIDIKPVEDSMTQTVDLGLEFLEHHGVKGMKWGVRKEDAKIGIKKSGRAGISGGSAAALIGLGPSAVLIPRVRAEIGQARAHNKGVNAQKKADKQDKKFTKKASVVNNFADIHNGAVKGMNRRQAEINKKYEGIDLNSTANKKKYDAYMAETTAMMRQEYQASANRIKSKSGRLQLDLEFDNEDNFKIRTKTVRHAVDDVISGKVIRNKTGHIVSLEFDGFVQHDLFELGEEFLIHYGVKGMRWGVRKDKNTPSVLERHRTNYEEKIRAKRPAIAPRVQDTIGSSKRKKTEIQRKGGEDHPASEDALKAAGQHQKLKKSGVAALSNQELRDLSTRLQLEAQAEMLTTSKGRKFVQRSLSRQAEQQTQRGLGNVVDLGVGAASKRLRRS